MLLRKLLAIDVGYGLLVLVAQVRYHGGHALQVAGQWRHHENLQTVLLEVIEARREGIMKGKTDLDKSKCWSNTVNVSILLDVMQWICESGGYFP